MIDGVETPYAPNGLADRQEMTINASLRHGAQSTLGFPR